MKHHPLWKLTQLLILLAIAVSPIASAYAAPVRNQPADLRSGIKVIDAAYVGKSKSLRSLTPIKTDANTQSALRKMENRTTIPKTLNTLTSGGSDTSIVQGNPVKNSMPDSVANFEGVGNISGVLPPDTQGDIGWNPSTGTKYYIQWVNLAFEIWDVTAPAAPVSLYGPAAGNTLWAGTGTICASNNDGDPITQFDHLSNRWMMSQFALGFPNNFHQCIAVSATADPLGAWYLYDFQVNTVNFNDYGKFGVWADGYYMSVNQFNGSSGAWAGAGVAVFERTKMLTGLPARMIYIDTGKKTLNYGGMLPSDLDGPAPADGTPNYFMEWDDTTWSMADPTDTLRVWEFKTDWTIPANTTFGLNANYDPNLKITTANVDPSITAASQPGTAQGLDTIADRLMYRLQYRNFGSYQTLVGNHTVDATGTDKAGIHWFELRDTGAGFAMNQEGVYAPDSDHRWMGSVAMDGSGDIALGYSVSSSTTYPSIRYTGRLSTDPSGTLPQGESTLIAGTGSQTHPAARWGDYSMMAVDPSDDCTFWYTTEYIKTTGSAPWKTRIGSFKFPSCTTAPTGVLSGTITDSTAQPIAGVTVNVSGGFSTITDASGHYLLRLLDGTYNITASKYGYITDTASGIVVTSPDTTTQDFALNLAAISDISGVVTDATTGWPLYARLDIYGYPGNAIFTDPVTGAYNISLINSDYTFTVTAMSGGYTPTVLPLTISADGTQNFALAADLNSCSAPGYQAPPPSFSEDFETWPPANWTIVDNTPVAANQPNGGGGGGGSGGLLWNTNDSYGLPNLTSGAGIAATVSSDTMSGPYDTDLQSPVIDPLTLINKNLTYQANYQALSGDALDLDIKNVGDADWTTILHWTTNHGSLKSLPGEKVALDLTSYITGNFQLRWRYYTPDPAPWNWYAEIDNVKLGINCNPLPSTGLVVGSVFDVNNNQLIPGASVKDSTQLYSSTLIDASADAASPAQLYIMALPSGAQTLTGSAVYYQPDTQPVNVVTGSTIRQDFHLPIGVLATNPTSLSFSVYSNAPPASKTITVNNTGTAPIDYRIFAMPGTFTGYAPTGPFALHTRHTGPPHLNDLDASHLRTNFTPTGVPTIAGGTVLASWPTGLAYPWGIGYNTDTNDIWLGNIGAGGGDNRNYRFTTTGVNTGDTIDTSAWVGTFAGDMTYNPFTHMLWQVNVGSDNCIYELDPATKIATGKTICPGFGTSERGLAFDPLTNTFYAGSWNDGIINHFAPDGTLLNSTDVGLSISGLAFNPSTGHLFVMTNAIESPDVYVIDTKTTAYNIIGAFYLKDGNNKVITGAQAGLEIDCDGNLWAVNQTTKTVYKAASGETGVCDWPNTWLSATPNAGSIVNGSHANVTIKVNVAGLTAGSYPAYLHVVGNSSNSDQIIPINLTVKAPIVKTFISNGAQDGWVLESGENTSIGDTINSTAATFRLGDDATNKQYRSILSFKTSSLPDNAIITGIVLKIKRQSIVGGGNPFALLLGGMFDVKKGIFGTLGQLQANDFEAPDSGTYGPYTAPSFVNNVYTINLINAKANINKLLTNSGLTQIRLRFKLDDNNNTTANYLNLYSGDAPNAQDRPTLVISYTLP